MKREKKMSMSDKKKVEWLFWKERDTLCFTVSTVCAHRFLPKWGRYLLQSDSIARGKIKNSLLSVKSSVLPVKYLEMFGGCNPVANRSRSAETEKQLIRHRKTNLEASSPSGPRHSHQPTRSRLRFLTRLPHHSWSLIHNAQPSTISHGANCHEWGRCGMEYLRWQCLRL